MLGGQMNFALTTTTSEDLLYFMVICSEFCMPGFWRAISPRCVLSWVLITHSHKYVVMIFVYTNNLTRTKRKTIKMNYAPAQSVWMLRPRATETMCYSPFCVGPLLTCHQSLWRNDIQRLEFIPGFSPLFIHIRIRLCAFECHNTNFVCMFELMN